jgi:hypothetical protein
MWKIISFILVTVIIFTEVVLGQSQTGTLEEAETLIQKALDLSEAGKYEEVIPQAERALEIYERVLGEDHPNVAISLNIIANLY